MKPLCPVNNTLNADSFARVRRQLRQRSSLRHVLGEIAVLFRSKLVAEAAVRKIDVPVRNRLILQHIALEAAAFRQPDRKQIVAKRYGGVFDRSLAREPANTIELLARAQVALGHRDHVA